MAGKLEKQCVDLLLDLTGGVLEETPDWLSRPGKRECSERWRLVCEIYETLTGGILPDTMPPRERRTLDAVVKLPKGERFLFEFDETQHFNQFRLATLERYPSGLTLRFDKDAYKRACAAKQRLEGGGFGQPRPPLFPDDGGRHRQRAFRDALADLLPDQHGFGPTLRLAYFEFSTVDQIATLIRRRLDRH